MQEKKINNSKDGHHFSSQKTAAQVRGPLPKRLTKLVVRLISFAYIPLGKKKKLCFFFLTLLLRSEARAPTQVFYVLFINKGDIARGC